MLSLPRLQRFACVLLEKKHLKKQLPTCVCVWGDRDTILAGGLITQVGPIFSATWWSIPKGRACSLGNPRQAQEITVEENSVEEELKLARNSNWGSYVRQQRRLTRSSLSVSHRLEEKDAHRVVEDPLSEQNGTQLRELRLPAGTKRRKGERRKHTKQTNKK